MDKILEYLKGELFTLKNFGRIISGGMTIIFAITIYKAIPGFNKWMNRPKVTIVNTTIDGNIVQYANATKISNSTRMKNRFNFRPGLLFSEQLYQIGWLTEIKAENDQIFMLLTTAPIPDDLKDFSIYYVRASGPNQTFQSSAKEDQYVEIIFPIYSMTNLSNSPISI